MTASLTSPWALLCLGTYAVLVVIVLAANHGAHRKPSPTEEIRQPDIRSWLCSDGYYRTEAEAADWVHATPGASAWVDGDDSTWLDPWPAGEAIPDYVPQEWSA